jgi:transposase
MGRKRHYPIQLSQEERHKLEALVKGGQNKVRVIHRAQILLWSEEGRSNRDIAELLQLTPLTVARTQQRWVEKHSLEDEPRAGRPPCLDGKQEAFLVALTCSEAPEGLERWSVRLLADKLVELGVVEGSISKDSVARRLKKMS